MTLLPPVLSQRTYPSAGDLDDCWVVATVWAAIASRPTIWRPTVTYFRAKAGDPDDGYTDGGSIQEVYDGATGCWPWLSLTKYVNSDYGLFLTSVKAGRPASVALDSAALPATHRFNFYGKHQVGVAWDGSRFRLANPLAPEGSSPLPITQTALLYAMSKLISPPSYRAVLFPKPVSGPHWGADVGLDIQRAYTANQVATKLRSLGITTYGQAVNLIDLEAGLRKRGINYGTSVQLIDVRALMKPGTGA